MMMMMMMKQDKVREKILCVYFIICVYDVQNEMKEKVEEGTVD